MSGVRASVGMFRMPGYPWICREVQSALDQAVRVAEDADDPVEMALDLADVLEVAAQVLRDFGADLFGEAAS